MKEVLSNIFVKEKKKILLFLLLVVLFIMIPIISSLTKFIREELYDYHLASKGFYFTSNRLKEDTPLYQVNNWSGVGSFDITFDVLSSLNNKTMTDYDIAYKVSYTCEGAIICSPDKETGTIYTATHSDTVTIGVVPQRTFEENESIKIHVEATSTDPYVKTLSADFEYIVGKKGTTYSISDSVQSPYLLLKITNANTYCTVKTAFGNYSIGDNIDVNDFQELSEADRKNCVSRYITLTFDPKTILLDTTSSILDDSTIENETINNVDYVSKITFSVDAMSSKDIRFYKVDPSKNYTYPLDGAESIIEVEVTEP